MESKFYYNKQTQELVEEFIDVGYMAENFEVQDLHVRVKSIKRSNPKRSMSLFVSAPFVFDALLKLDVFMSKIQVDINCYFIFDASNDALLEFAKGLKKFEVLIDHQEEFGLMYGVKIVDGTLKGKLAKALFLISGDGAVFYIDMPINLEEEFDLESLHVGLNKAYATYKGASCHG